MNDLDDKIAARRKEKRKSKSKKKRRSPSFEEDVVIGQLKSPPELLANSNQATKFSSSSGDSSASSRGKSSKDDSSENYDASVAKMPAAKLPGAYAAKSTDVSAAEQFKFGTSSKEIKSSTNPGNFISSFNFDDAESATKPGAFSASNEELSAAERLKFGMASAEVRPATMPGAFSATNEDLSAAERLKFGIVSNAEVAPVPIQAPPQTPGAFFMGNAETSAAERLKFGIAQPVPLTNNEQMPHFEPTSEYGQSYESFLTGDNVTTQTDQNNEVIEAEVVSGHGYDDGNLSHDFDLLAWIDGQLSPKQWRSLCFICSFVSFIIIISLSAALDSAKKSANENNNPKQPTKPPVSPPVDISWCFNSTEYVENVRYAALRSALVASGVSTDNEFATDDSYQRKSLCWLAFGDALQIDESDPFIEQRFALATIFYSLNEPKKLLSSGWLSGKQECNWVPMVECDSRTKSTVSKLDLAGFDLQGQLPKELSSLQYVTNLDLSENLLDGGVTEATSGWKNLQELRLANNRFEAVPEIIDEMSSMTYFDVSSNNITGRIPVFLTFMSNLVYLDISSNSFSDSIPDYMGGNLPSLYSLYMHENDLTGTMPQSICDLRDSNLKRLSVDCGVGKQAEGRDVDCDVPQCCTVCNGYF